jgi:hypothetical protein
MITKAQEDEIRKVLDTMPMIECHGFKIAYWWVMTYWKKNSVVGERNVLEIATVIDLGEELGYGLPSNGGMRCAPRHNPEFELIGPVERPSEKMLIALYDKTNEKLRQTRRST